MSAYRKLLSDTILRLPCVSDTHTFVVMEEVKQTSSIVIDTTSREVLNVNEG